MVEMGPTSAQIVALILGLSSFGGFLVGLIPFLGWVNWLNIPGAIASVIVSLIGTSERTREGRNMAFTGLALSLVAICFGLVRLVLGGGIL